MSEVQGVELPELSPDPRGNKLLEHRMGLVQDVPVTAVAILGSATLTLGRLMALKEGEVLELIQDVGQWVDIQVGGKPVGRGEIVVVGDRFGILVKELAAT